MSLNKKYRIKSLPKHQKGGEDKDGYKNYVYPLGNNTYQATPYSLPVAEVFGNPINTGRRLLQNIGKSTGYIGDQTMQLLSTPEALASYAIDKYRGKDAELMDVLPSLASDVIGRKSKGQPDLITSLTSDDWVRKNPGKALAAGFLMPGFAFGKASKASSFMPRISKKTQLKDYWEKIAEDADNIKNYREQLVKDLTSDEGLKRLKEQEYSWAKREFPEKNEIQLRDFAEQAAFARINDINNMKSFNELVKAGQRDKQRALFEAYKPDFENAHFRRDADLREDKYSYAIPEEDLIKGSSRYTPSHTAYSPYYFDYNPVKAHEYGHAFQYGRILPVDDELRKLIKPKAGLNMTKADYYPALSNFKKYPIKNLQANFNRLFRKNQFEDYDYFARGSGGKEPSAFAHELRQIMIDRGILKSRYDEVTPEKLKLMKKSKKINPGDKTEVTRMLDFMQNTESNYKNLSKIMNKLPVFFPAAIGLSALEKEKKGGEGYRKGAKNYNAPYKFIPSGNITMTEKDGGALQKGPLLGIDNMGNQQMMFPGYNYVFPGDMVMEIPVAQKGIESKDAMMKNAIARNTNVPFVKRLTLSKKDSPSLYLGKDKEGYDMYGSHELASFGNYVLPNIVQEGNTLKQISEDGNFDEIFEYHRNQGFKNGLYFNNPKDAEYFAEENYKRVSPAFQKQKGGEKAYETWQRVTGTPWAEAKKQGLTDGSYKGNLALQQKLFQQSEQPTIKPTVKPSVKQQTQQSSDYNFDNLTFNEAFGKAREMYGANKIFKYKGHLKNTNRSGEPFEPSEEELTKWGLNTKNKKQNIKKQNKIIESPYTSQDDFNTAALSTATDAENRFLREKEFMPEPTSKDEYLQQQGDGKYEYWKDVKQRQKDINKMDNANVVVNYQKNKAKSDYVVIDKSKGLMHLYHPKQDRPYLTYPVDLGSNVGDGQTVTKTQDVDGDGNITIKDKVDGKYKVDWNAGNKSTGAGKFYISNLRKEGYAGLPSFNMMNEAQYNEYKKSGKIERVSTSIHSGYVSDDQKRVSNGCVRCTKGAVNNLYSALEGGSEVFILPEEKQNNFYVKDDKLYFKNKNRKKYYKYEDSERIYKKEKGKWYISDKNQNNFTLLKNYGGMYDELDKKSTGTFKVNKGEKERKLIDLQYEVYEDKNGKIQRGQGINRTPGSRNYKPIKIDIDKNLFVLENDERRLNEIVLPYTKAIEDSKKKIMDVFGITSDQYNDLVPVAMGILGNETAFGNEFNFIGNFARAGKKFFKPKSSSPDYISKYYTYGADEDVNSVGLTQFRWNNMKEMDLLEKMKKLGVTNNEQLLDPQKAAIHAMGRLAFLIRNRRFNKDLDYIDTVPGMWGGSSSDNKATYTRGVKNNSKYFNVLQYKQRGGEMLRVYDDYINGLDNSSEAKKTFDKLNRVYYSEAKQNNMSASDYIMTYLIN